MADTRALQRRLSRIKQIETYASNNLTKEPIEGIKTNLKLIVEEWEDYKASTHIYSDSPENIALQDQIETKCFAIKGKLMQAEMAIDKGQPVDLDPSLQELMANQRSFLHEISNLNIKGESDVRLPRVNIPFFSGIYAEFASFRDLFEASINSNTKMSKVHKLQYLKGLLKGEAAALVRHITITDANYDEAWEMIINRYDKKKHVITMFLKQFIDQPTITQNSAKSLHHMHDVSDEVLRGIKVLGKEAESRDPWLIYILVSKLDATTKQAWAQQSYGIEFPTIKQFLDFLSKQSDTLESCEPTKRIPQRPTLNPSMKVMHLDAQVLTCLKCGKEHYLRNCDEFLQLSVNERRGFVANNKLCFVCLFKNHQSQHCRSRYRCGICQAKHHSTLHQNAKQTPSGPPNLKTEVEPSNSRSSEQNVDSMSVAHALSFKQFAAILPTAVIRVLDSSNNYQNCRVLLDSGAQASFIFESCARRLALPRTHAKILIKGLTPGTEITRGKLSINAISLYPNSETIKLEVLILNKLTNCLPTREINSINVVKIKDLQLADPHFYKPAVVDIIIGADHFFHILREGRINNLSDKLIAQNSMFGWILSGEVSTCEDKSCVTSLNYHINLNIDETLRRFWEMEEIPAIKSFSQEENDCEEHFKTNFLRGNTDQYIVKLPFKTLRTSLGNSLDIAKKKVF